MNIPQSSIQTGPPLILATIMICVWGILGYRDIPKTEYPDVDFPVCSIGQLTSVIHSGSCARPLISAKARVIRILFMVSKDRAWVFSGAPRRSTYNNVLNISRLPEGIRLRIPSVKTSSKSRHEGPTYFTLSGFMARLVRQRRRYSRGLLNPHLRRFGACPS